MLNKGLLEKYGMNENSVIEALNPQHAKIILQFFADLGASCQYYRGLNTRAGGHEYRFYGLRNGHFNCYRFTSIESKNITNIPASYLSKCSNGQLIPIEDTLMLVKDSHKDEFKPRVVFGFKNGKALYWTACSSLEKAKNVTSAISAKEFKSLPKKVELTMQQIADKFNLNVESIEISDYDKAR